MAKSSALVLSSGGLHSLVAAGLASREFRIGMLHLDDGRTAARQAAAAFVRQVEHFKPLRHWIAEAGYLRQMALPPETAGLVNATGSDPQASLVPLRELQFLSVAAGFARQIHATTIFWGLQYEQRAADALARNIELVQVFNGLLEVLSPEAPLVVKTPLMGLEDHQVIQLGYQMGLPFGASWTCQMPAQAAPTAAGGGGAGAGETPCDTPCMSCPACARRIRAFRAAQLTDPLVVKR
jgi:7-cyano-7-deazaguanine synthase in queuosine biosynthesis